jgi:membrane glycosyltransferase
MDFVQHAINWCKGEIFEARLILLFGLLTMVCAFLFWRLGTTPNAKAMLFPFLVLGLMFSIMGGGMLNSNPKRTRDFQAAWEENPRAFAESEKERADEFISWYPITRYIAAGIGILGVVLFLLWDTPMGRAIGMALILATLATFVVDHFSEERADTYYEKIVEYLGA